MLFPDLSHESAIFHLLKYLNYLLFESEKVYNTFILKLLEQKNIQKPFETDNPTLVITVTPTLTLNLH